MALTLPELKHEYIFQLDTEETKNSVFDQCREEAKEAAYSTFGTNQNDAEYYPSPVKDPDYLMDYCTSDGHDYLKDYRLIWGYGIGIIEQDVICSLTTGEHLAEGKDACDTYAAENAAGENTDWKRGTWIKFSGNRNVSPTRIGEVILPDYVISLKDLCAAINPTSECLFEFFKIDETKLPTLLNISNLCAQKANIKVNITEDNCIATSVIDMSYAFANVSFTETSLVNRFLGSVAGCLPNMNHGFYNATVYTENTPMYTDGDGCDLTSMFEGATINVDNDENLYTVDTYIGKATFKNVVGVNLSVHNCKCQEDVSECFYGSKLTNITNVNFSNAKNLQEMFCNITLIDEEVNLDLSTVVEHDDDIEDRFSNFFSTNSQNKTINITAPDCKLKGLSIFTFYNSNINVTNTLHYYDYDDVKITDTTFIYDRQRQYRPCFILNNCKSVNGNFNGTSLFYINTTIEQCNITVSSKTLNKDELVNLFSIIPDRKSFIMPCIFYISNGYTNINTILSGLNIDNFYFPNNIFYGINNDYDNTDFIINKNNKEYCITNNSNVCNCTIKSNNAIIHYRYLYKYTGYLTEFEHSVNIESDNEINIDGIMVTGSTHRTLISYNIPNGNLVFTRYDDSVKEYQVKLEILFNNINTIDFTNLNLAVSHTGYNYIRIKANKINTIKKNNGTSIDEYDLDTEEIVVVIKTDNNFNYIFDNNDYIPSLVVRSYNEDKLINYPIFNNGGYTKSYLIGQFNNTPLSDYIIRNIYNTNLELTPYIYGKTIEQIVDDIESEDVIVDRTINDLLGLLEFKLYGNFNHNFKIINDAYLRYIGGIDNKYLHCNKFDVNVIKSGSTGTDFYYYYMDYINSNINCDSFDLISYLRLYNCNNCTDCNIEYNYNVYNVLIDDLSNNIQNLSLNFVIVSTCNLSYLDKLTQESLNNIINPSNYRSGAILTINTIPFQYITDEQKQALTDAGVTLVEYIPTETTE